MLRPNASPFSEPDPASSLHDAESSDVVAAAGGVDIQQELNQLEELILANPRVPFSGRTLVDEDQLLDQLDQIRLNLPGAFREATRILQQRDAIIAEAQRYAQDLVIAAEQESNRRLNELGIVQQAEQRAQQIHQQTQQECEQLRSHVLSEIDQMRVQAQREWESLRQQALSEQQSIQMEADIYAGEVLGTLEQHLSTMLRTVQNGRSQLESTATSSPPPRKPAMRDPRRERPPRSPQ